MKSYDYNAVVYGNDIYCCECLPADISILDDDVTPIFAGSEWDYMPVCCVCSCEHDYVTIIGEE